MMSSEEDPDLGGGDKKPKRVRQRVDAGEPRNSYASIPNYSPRLYPPNGYGKMLCDLGVLSNGKSSDMVVLESNGGFGSPERCSSSGGSSDSHLLRDILQQGRHGPGSPPDFRPPEPHSEDSNDSKASKMSGGAIMASSAPSGDPPAAAADLKRARVETIVSNMMVRTPPVNGCKKRKLYQPQQHERPASEEDEEPCSSPKRRPSSAGLFTFRQQLRHMQQQLVQMQQQYMEMVDGEDSADEVDAKPTFNHDEDSASLYEDSGRKLVVDCDPPPPQKDGGGERQTCIVPPAPVDIEWLAESLKAELSTSLSQVVDAVVSRCVQRKAAACKSSPTETSTPKGDPTLLSQMLDRKSPRTGGKVVDRGARVNGSSPFPADSAPPPPQQPPPRPPFLFPLKPSVAATAAFLYGSPPSYAPSPPHESSAPEQTEAMSLVVSNKKKRHKVTDTRLNRLCPGEASPKYGGLLPDPSMYHHHHPPPPPLVPVSLPTTVAIPNPSLNQSELFHGFGGYDPHRFGPPMDDDEGPPPQVPLHALMPFHAGPHHRGSPDQMSHHLKHQDSTGDMSDTGDSPAGYDNGMAMISFLRKNTSPLSPSGSMHTSTLTPMHLRKAKLMFFYARYPSSAVLKMYFPDIRFNKNNTAQLVKWFSNFREFFYIQMEKYARQAITEGVKNAEDLKVDADSELLRVLNLHYNRNNHIPAPHTFRNVVEQTLREFYKALVAGKDSEQSWKKSIYKIIARLDDSVPDYFKSPDFFDKLE